MRWGSNETYSFVKLYLNHRCLWDNRDYNDKLKKYEAYRDISDKFQALHNYKLNETNVKMKIKSLRSTYSQYKKKAQQERLCFESLHKGTWLGDFHKCFSSIEMPNKTYEEDVSDDQLEAETESEDQSQNIWVQDNSAEFSEEDQINPIISPTDDDFILLLKDEPDETSNSRKRKYEWHNRNSLGNSSTQSVKHMRKETSSNEDEFDIYGKYIASQLREMGLEKALRVQLQVQNIVSEARLETLND